VLLLVHLEGFRRLRVMVGRDASDRMVAEAARRMVAVVGDDLVGRVSDAEFAILARDLPEDGGAESLAERVGQALDFEFSGAAVRSTVGFSRFPRDADQLEALLLAAEASLLAAQPANRT
jgi:predicted signal transduction protein with EAL and GGDEF domain